MGKSTSSGVSVLKRGDSAEFYTIAEIEEALPSWRIENIELTEREMQDRHIPLPKDGVDGWTARMARVAIGDAVRICRVWSRRK